MQIILKNCPNFIKFRNSHSGMINNIFDCSKELYWHSWLLYRLVINVKEDLSQCISIHINNKKVQISNDRSLPFLLLNKYQPLLNKCTHQVFKEICNAPGHNIIIGDGNYKVMLNLELFVKLKFHTHQRYFDGSCAYLNFE